jgi:hypothetical protein
MGWKENNVKGALVSKVFATSELSKLGLKKGSVITSIGDACNEFDIDRNGLVNLKHQLDKVPFQSLNVLLLLDPDSTFIRVYNGCRKKTLAFTLAVQQDILRNCMPVLEPIPCAVFGGIVFCQFFNNHIEEIEDETLDPGIVQFLSESKGSESTVVITAFRLPSAILQQGYSLRKLTVLKKVNKKVVKTIDALKATLEKAIRKYIKDNKSRYVELEIGASSVEIIYADLDLVFSLEPQLYCTPGYKRECSVITIDMLQGRKRSFDNIS